MYKKETLAERLSDLRKPKGKTLYTFEGLSLAIEKKTGIRITASALQQYENSENHKRPNAEFLYALAKFYNVTSDYLLGLTDCTSPKEEKQAAGKRLGLSSDAQEVLEYHEQNGLYWFANTVSLLICNPHEEGKNPERVIDLISRYIKFQAKKPFIINAVDGMVRNLKPHEVHKNDKSIYFFPEKFEEQVVFPSGIEDSHIAHIGKALRELKRVKIEIDKKGAKNNAKKNEHTN